MSKATSTKAEALFWELGADLMSQHPAVVEGTIMNGRCLRVGKEFLALVDYKDLRRARGGAMDNAGASVARSRL